MEWFTFRDLLQSRFLLLLLPSLPLTVNEERFLAFGARLQSVSPAQSSASSTRARRVRHMCPLLPERFALGVGRPRWQFNRLFVGKSFGPRIGPSFGPNFGPSVKLKRAHACTYKLPKGLYCGLKIMVRQLATVLARVAN